MARQMQHVATMSRLQDLRYFNRPIIAEFYTEYAFNDYRWCAPCKRVRSVLEKELNDNPNAFTVANINTDEADEVVIEYEVEVVPTVVVLKRDEKLTVVDRRAVNMKELWVMRRRSLGNS